MFILYVTLDEDDDRWIKIDQLIRKLGKSRTVIGFPAPALSEFLVGADEAAVDITSSLQKKRAVTILPFDATAAYEAALITRDVIPKGKKGGSGESWQKIKFDRQIVAIAKTRNATALYSSDNGLIEEAKKIGIKAFALDDLVLEPFQQSLLLPYNPGLDTSQP